MKLLKKHVGKLVKVIKDVTSNDMQFFDYDGEPYAIIAGPDWIDYIEEHQPSYADYEERISYLPEELVGLVVEIAEPYPRVTINYARVLFPESIYLDPDNIYLAYPQETKNVAGAYWISGDFLEVFETDTSE